MTTKQDNGETLWHGSDEKAAVARAKRFGGQVVYSIAPGTENVQVAKPGDWGYYSEGGGHSQMIRNWERLVWVQE